MPALRRHAYRCVVHESDDREPSPTVHDRQDLMLATGISAVVLVVVVLASILVVVGGA